MSIQSFEEYKNERVRQRGSRLFAQGLVLQYKLTCLYADYLEAETASLRRLSLVRIRVEEEFPPESNVIPFERRSHESG